jgi:hypothetical protein
MNTIPNEIRARLKRLSPYAGPFVPDSVRENAKYVWPAHCDQSKCAGWIWEGGSGVYQCELELCDLDEETVIDPAGYVAIRPLEDGRWALIFVISGIKWDPEDLVFPTKEAAKHYLDTLLAAETPLLPCL